MSFTLAKMGVFTVRQQKIFTVTSNSSGPKNEFLKKRGKILSIKITEYGKERYPKQLSTS
jgi:hypothetical protein